MTEENKVCSIELAFGHKRMSGEALPVALIQEAEMLVLTLFGECFGGGQRYRAFGSYKADGQVIFERCTVLRACTLEVKEYWDKLHALVGDVAVLLDQRSVFMKVVRADGSALLIERKK